MNREQYLRVDIRAFLIIGCILVYIMCSMVWEIIADGPQSGTYVQLAVALLMFIIIIIGLAKFRGKRICGSILTGSGALTFLVVMVFTSSEMSFVYAFPILITSMMYLNARFAVIGSSIILLANVLRTVIDIATEDFNIRSCLIRWFLTVYVCAASYIVTKMIQVFNEENINSIKIVAKEQKMSVDRMKVTADDINSDFEKANEMMIHLEECIESNNSAMRNIAESTESTAEAIQEQAKMCANIQESSNIAEKETANVAEISLTTSENVAEGVSMVNSLRNQAAAVEESSRQTVSATARLTERVDEVKNIVGDILNISSQTNLLALNASIEAARAGEAGKGFAVVADEIRQLSEQTKSATERITGIIKDLIEDSRSAAASLNNSVETIGEQTTMIDTTKEKFEKINDEVMELAGSINMMEETVETILKATAVITDNITQLSASSEEVAASSEEGMKTADEAVNQMRECRVVLESIHTLAQELESTT